MEARVYFFADPEPEPIPRLQVELDAEVARLIAGKSGESELEFIYANNPGPVARKWAIWDLGQKRIGLSLKPFMKGVIDYEVIAQPHSVAFELTYANTHSGLKFGPRAQRTIVLPILNSERPKELAPVGDPSGQPPLTLTKVAPAPARPRPAPVAQPAPAKTYHAPVKPAPARRPEPPRRK